MIGSHCNSCCRNWPQSPSWKLIEHPSLGGSMLPVHCCTLQPYCRGCPPGICYPTSFAADSWLSQLTEAYRELTSRRMITDVCHCSDVHPLMCWTKKLWLCKITCIFFLLLKCRIYMYILCGFPLLVAIMWYDMYMSPNPHSWDLDPDDWWQGGSYPQSGACDSCYDFAESNWLWLLLPCSLHFWVSPFTRSIQTQATCKFGKRCLGVDSRNITRMQLEVHNVALSFSCKFPNFRTQSRIGSCLLISVVVGPEPLQAKINHYHSPLQWLVRKN